MLAAEFWTKNGAYVKLSISVVECELMLPGPLRFYYPVGLGE